MNQQIKNSINPKEQLELDKKKGMTIAKLAEKYFSEQLGLRRTFRTYSGIKLD